MVRAPVRVLSAARRRPLSGTSGFRRLIVDPGVLRSFPFSLTLFTTATAQADVAFRAALGSLDEAHTPKTLSIAAAEQAEVLRVGLALLMIPFGLPALCVGRMHNVPAWLHLKSSDGLKQKLFEIVIVALSVKFFSEALKCEGGSGNLADGAASAAVMLAVCVCSVMLSRQGGRQWLEDHAQP
ncbi:YqhA family protein [Deinococcus taeanensis]|uniref:YqhA family protein n=1 Tax=Deinococcus taeanensis TaxID=2737050 RepID=UPI001CDD184C|nr:YqhA family protein [Deinococcus taeanensis]UBV42542.1 YqhA family protein [Deinococcus taeanensis]